MTESVTYDYEELIHDYEGLLVPCRECGTWVFLKHVAAFGCHMCDVDASDVTIRRKDND